MMSGKLKKLLLAGLFLFAGAAFAGTPHALVEVMTDDLLASMETYRDTVDEKPEPFFEYLEERLQDIIDFKGIAVNVMGPYRKSASDEQKERFAQVFRRGLVETYGRGLLTYTDEKIVVMPPESDINGKKKVKVVQEIHGSDKVYPVSYTMRLNKQSEWKIANVTITGVNLGKTFRNQFIQAAKKHGGDIDKVIDTWAVKV